MQICRLLRYTRINAIFGDMTLREWIADNPGLNQSEVARQLGMTRAAVSKMILGYAKPSLEIAVAIERLTDGKVPPSSWLTAA